MKPKIKKIVVQKVNGKMINEEQMIKLIADEIFSAVTNNISKLEPEKDLKIERKQFKYALPSDK
jgi:CRISPR/Cas system CSM-associated protein Csm4 (group 5 of RAMP superfamily)